MSHTVTYYEPHCNLLWTTQTCNIWCRWEDVDHNHRQQNVWASVVSPAGPAWHFAECACLQLSLYSAQWCHGTTSNAVCLGISAKFNFSINMRQRCAINSTPTWCKTKLNVSNSNLHWRCILVNLVLPSLYIYIVTKEKL